MILEKLVIVAALFMSYFLQKSAVDFFRLGSIKPDFLVILVVYFAVYRSIFFGVITGSMAGLLLDIDLGGFLNRDGAMQYHYGTFTFTMAFIGYLAGKVAPTINKDGNIMISLLALGFTLLKGLFTFIIVPVFHDKSGPTLSAIIGATFYTAAISFLWFRLLKWALPTQQQNNQSTYRY